MTLKAETQALLQLLRDRHSAGGLVTYKEMSELIHANVQTKERHALEYALNVLRREHGLHYVCVVNQGYRPLSPSEVVKEKCGDRRRRIRSTATKWREDLESVSMASLSQDDMLHYIQRGLELQAIEIAASDETSNRIEQDVKKKMNPLECYKDVDVIALLGGVS